MVVYRHAGHTTQFLLISSRANPAKLTLPGGKISKHEAAFQCAIRETIEEAGVLTDQHRPLGEYLHPKANQRIYPTQTFLGRFAGQLDEYEPRSLHWLTLEELAMSRYQVRRPVRRELYRASRRLRLEQAVA